MFLIIGLALPARSLQAGAGHAHAEAHGSEADITSGIIKVSEQGKQNLGIEVAAAEVVEIEKTLKTIVEIVPIPSQMAVVASRIPGKVKSISATAGETVRAGTQLVEIESFQPGNPPPSVQYAAPISGIITHWDAAVGESVEPNGHLLEIVDLSQVFAEITLFEGQLSQVELGQTVRVYVESFPGKLFEGKIGLISGQLDPETRSLKVYAKIANAGARLRPHMRGTCHVVIEKLDAVIGIPHPAVTGDPGSLSAFVQLDADGLEYEQRPIVLGAEDDRFVEVIEGVLPGEQVVVSGNYQLQFVQNKAAIPAGGGHGHDHGPGGEHLTEEDAIAHGEKPAVPAEAEAARARPSIGSALTIGLAIGLVLSLGLNVLLIFTRKPAAPAS